MSLSRHLPGCLFYILLELALPDIDGLELLKQRMLASGKQLKKIADEVSPSLNTASTYRIRILKKLNLDNNADQTSFIQTLPRIRILQHYELEPTLCKKNTLKSSL